LLFKNINYNTANDKSLKYNRFAPTGWIRKCEFVAKTQLLLKNTKQKSRFKETISFNSSPKEYK